MICELRGNGRCEGRPQLHHYVPRQRIRNELGRGSEIAEHAVEDPRNLVWLCRFHHEQLHNWAMNRPELEPNAEIRDFAEEYGLLWSLP